MRHWKGIANLRPNWGNPRAQEVVFSQKSSHNLLNRPTGKSSAQHVKQVIVTRLLSTKNDGYEILIVCSPPLGTFFILSPDTQQPGSSRGVLGWHIQNRFKVNTSNSLQGKTLFIITIIVPLSRTRKIYLQHESHGPGVARFQADSLPTG